MLNLKSLRKLCTVGSRPQISKNFFVTQLLQFLFLFSDFFHNKLQLLRQFGKTVKCKRTVALIKRQQQYRKFP